MKLHEKIKQIRQKKKISREELYRRLFTIFGDKAVKPNTIWRIESGLTTARASSLHQISIGLRVSLKEILGDIEANAVTLIKKDNRIDKYIYNRKVQAEILTPNNQQFVAQELTFLAGGKTRTEEENKGKRKFKEWIYCLAGKLTCIVGTQRYNLEKDDCLIFESSIPHYFENNSSKKVRCIIIKSSN